MRERIRQHRIGCVVIVSVALVAAGLFSAQPHVSAADTVPTTNVSRPNGPQGLDGRPTAASVAASSVAITPAQIVARAWYWYVTSGNPPYGQQAYWHSRTDYAGDGKGDFPTPWSTPASWREDCSGFVSYAWGFWDLDGGFTTYYARSYSYPILWMDLLPGDALLLNGVNIGGVVYNHMGLFMGWNLDGTYNVMNETVPGRGTQYQTEIPINDGFWQYAQPIRYNGDVPPSPAINGVATSMAVTTNNLLETAVETPQNGLDLYWESSRGAWKGPVHIGASGTVFSAPSLVVNSHNLGVISVQGPGHTLDLYWEAPTGYWYGPRPLGSAFSAPSLTNTSHDLQVTTVQGPGQTLDLYWEAPTGYWYGPVAVAGPGSSFSAPALTNDSSDLQAVSVEGPYDSLMFSWEDSNGAWHGPLHIGGSGTSA